MYTFKITNYNIFILDLSKNYFLYEVKNDKDICLLYFVFVYKVR